jgi:SAM-dependent methyltransferase
MQQAPAVLFAQNWHVYQKIIAQNYMLHNEFSEHTKLLLNAFGGLGIKLLDLGCGDAQLIASELEERDVQLYKGYDLSETALQQAATFTRPIKGSVELLHGRMEVLLKEDSDSYDFVYSSFAVHHLQDEEKQQLIGDLFLRLKSKGVFILIDIMRQNLQTRETYMQHYISGINANWDALLPAEILLIEEHIQQYDFPASMQDLIKWGEGFGFEVTIAPVEDDRHQMLIFSKP